MQNSENIIFFKLTN